MDTPQITCDDFAGFLSNGRDITATSERVKRIAAESDIAAKHRGVSSTNIGGRPTAADLNYLSLMVQYIEPWKALDVGSWVGTSSKVIAESYINAKVFTCDKQDVYELKHDRVIFANVHSTELLEKINCLDFVFIDANITAENAHKIVGSFPSGLELIAVHDLHMHNGRDNISRLLDALPELYFISPRNNYEDGGIGINNYIGALIGCDVLKDIRRWKK